MVSVDSKNRDEVVFSLFESCSCFQEVPFPATVPAVLLINGF